MVVFWDLESWSCIFRLFWEAGLWREYFWKSTLVRVFWLSTSVPNCFFNPQKLIPLLSWDSFRKYHMFSCMTIFCGIKIWREYYQISKPVVLFFGENLPSNLRSMYCKIFLATTVFVQRFWVSLLIASQITTTQDFRRNISTRLRNLRNTTPLTSSFSR